MKEELRLALVAASAAILGSLIGGFISYLGVDRSVGAQLDQQQRQFEEERDRLIGDRRTDVYTDYVDAAGAYANAAAELQSSFEELCGGEYDCTTDPAIVEGAAEYRTARYDYQAALNDVYIWGSDAAVVQSRAVSASLPPSLGVLGGSGLEGVESPLEPARFSAAYGAFLDLMCRELPPWPRGDCAEP